MSLISLFRSTSLRLVISNILTMLICFVIIGGVIFFLVQREINIFLDNALIETKQTLESSYKFGKKKALYALVTNYIQATSPKNKIYFMQDHLKNAVSGNIKTNYNKIGWANISPSLLSLKHEFPYRIYSFKIDGIYILIGRSREMTDELIEIILRVFSIGSLIILALVLGNGLLSAFAIQKRLNKIGLTLDHIATGNLQNRIALYGHEDDLDQLTVKINTTLQQLEDLFKGLQEVSANIAHDLKTPLNRLNMHINGMMELVASEHEASSFIQKAQKEIYALNETFDALLRIAQVEAGVRKSSFANINLTSILEPVIDAYQPVFEDKGYVLKLNYDISQIRPIFGDKELLIQMFANIIENVLRHCPKGTGLSLDIKQHKNNFQVRFCDNGAGIPKEEHQKVLQRLYRLDKSRTTLGSGLGLSLVKAISDLHHIPLTLEENNPGLCVIFNFRSI